MARLTKFLSCSGYGNDHECSFVRLLTSYFGASPTPETRDGFLSLQGPSKTNATRLRHRPHVYNGSTNRHARARPVSR